MKRDLRFERFYPHPPQRVWQALTDSQMMAQWLMENDFQAAVGHRFRFLTDPAPGFDGILYCEVRLIDPPYRLVYTFRGGQLTRDTLVTWTLTPQEGGTLLVLEHTGFTGLSEAAIADILSQGWGSMMNALPKVLEQLAANVANE